MTRCLSLLSVTCVAAAVCGPALAEGECRKIEDVVTIVAASGGALRPLTTRELDFARGLYVAQPNTPPQMPEGDSGLWVTAGDKVLVMFTRHGEACEVIAIGRDGARNFERLERPAGEPS